MGDQKNHVSVLGALCELDPPHITGQGIAESADATSYQILIELGALVHTRNARSVLCLACDRPHSIAVEYIDHGCYSAYCADTGYFDVPVEWIRQFAISEDWIARTIGAHLGLSPRRAQEYVELTRIGRANFGIYPCELFFARRLSVRSTYGAATRRIASLAGNASCVIVTTTSLDLIHGSKPPRTEIILLEDILHVSGHGVKLDESPFVAALRGGEHHFTGALGFSFSSGFRSVRFGDEAFSFSNKQALVIEALFEAQQTGSGRLHQSEVQGRASTTQRIGQLFRDHPAYGRLVKYDSQGFYWLDL